MASKSIIQLLSILIFSYLAYSLESPIAVQPSDHDGFSAERAMDHLHFIADKIHPIGSDVNDEKMEYIITQFRNLGYDVKEYIGQSSANWGGHYRLARSKNIIAFKPGSNPGKQVVVMGHYDSVFNSPGAADDGHSVAAMLDVAELIKDKTFRNDINFLVTDGEEMGLFGAQAYADQFNMDSIGVLLNFEARGNSGACLAFEWSDNNGWLVDAFKESVSKPIANSLSYEIYERMPNGSDFTMFKQKDVPGINHAFVDGFAYYHSPADTPENINQESVQHAGDYMYKMVQYFGDADFNTITRQGNATFFNLYTALIAYPGSFDLILLFLTFLLVLLNLVKRIKSEEKSIINLLKGLGVQVLVILITAGLAYLILQGLKSIYPHYFKFYSGQFYNHKWYLLSTTGIGLMIYAAISNWAFKGKVELITTSMYVLFLAMTVGFYFAIPTGTYLVMVPLLTFAVIDAITLYVKNTWIDKNKYILYLIPLIVALGLWIPSIHTIFLAFSLTGLMGPAVLIALFIPFISSSTASLWNEKKWMLWTSLGLTLFSFIGGHWTSSASQDRPVQSHLNYYVNQSEGKAYWYTNDEVNEGNAGVLEENDTVTINIPYETKAIASAADVNAYAPTIELLEDSLATENIGFYLPVTGTMAQLYFKNQDDITALKINGDEIPRDNGGRYITLYGFKGDFIHCEVVMKDDVSLDLGIAITEMGLPLNDILPVEYMRTGGRSITYMEKQF